MEIIELWLSLTNKSSLKLVGEELLDCDADCVESFGNKGLIQTLQRQHTDKYKKKSQSNNEFILSKVNRGEWL